MAVMKSGGSALDAVEIAIKVLEDREITNAGYGSNLAMDGVVECDAVIVDHHGRSGGAGAVARRLTTICSVHFTMLMDLCRDQEPNITRPSTSRSYDTNLVPPPSATESSRWTRSD